MSSTHRLDAAKRLQQHLEQFDWSAQTASRQQALEAFLRLANVHGFTAVTMRMLASELHIKAPSLYAHFPEGKDEIVAVSLRWHFSKFGSAILNAVDAAVGPAAFWDALVATHLSRQVRLPESNLWDLLVATDRTVHFLPVAVRADVDALVRHYEDMYRATATDMGVALSEEILALVMTVLEGATRWCRPDDLPDGIARAQQVSRMLLKLPAAASSQLSADEVEDAR
ncbi:MULTISPECIES: TetR/AcrR family transcriptional regulator [unclassified Curtobacterium]|uniref:TetR/AcrR family transcriptional regulator n=1 Tax=unclassified Curtobacterium TaxID=257496 RepID=UPI003A808C7E